MDGEGMYAQSKQDKLAANLRGQKTKILAIWQNRVRVRIPSAMPQDTPTVLDDVPALLENLAKSLQTSPQNVDSGSQVNGMSHVVERARLGTYTLEALITEYHVLRKVVLEVLHSTDSLDLNDYEKIQDFIQYAMVHAAIEFLRVQNETKELNASRLAFATEAAEIGLWEYDYNTQQIWRTATHDEVFGFKTLVPEWNRELFEKIIHLDDRERVMALFQKTEKPSPDWLIEYRVISPEGESLWVESKGRFIFGADGLPQRMIGANACITERKRQFEERMNYAAMAYLDLENLKAEREIRERFVSTLTHDLRSPLTAAKVSAQMLLRGIGNAEMQTKSAARILSCVERTDRMIQDLLDANTITAGHQVALKIVRCSFCDLMMGTIEELILVHGDRFDFKCVDGLEGYWDYDALRRVLENLINNAVKYGSDARISILAKGIEDTIEVSVHNFGGELSPPDQKMLFEQFRRLSSAKRSDHKGWGIGLTLVRGIIKAHGGSIVVNSGKGLGTTFTFTLPKDSRPFQKS